MKKLLVGLMAFAILLTSSLTVLAEGLIEDTDPDTGIIEDAPVEGDVLSVDEAALYKKQVKNHRNDVNSVLIANEEQQNMVDNFNEKADEFDVNLDNTVAAKGQKGFGGVIYDLSSIPQRVLLFGKMATAIRFATTHLRYKVEDAHVEIGFYIFEGLVMAVNPYATVDDMKIHMEEFEALKQKLLAYPDLTLNDTANLYIRSDLDKKLAKARRLQYHELKNHSTDVVKKLNREIADITGERLRPQATVLEIYQLSDRLDMAVAEALNSEDYKANSSQIREVKEIRRELRKARRLGDKRAEVGQVIDRISEEMLKIKPSAIIIEGLIETGKSLLH